MVAPGFGYAIVAMAAFGYGGPQSHELHRVKSAVLVHSISVQSEFGSSARLLFTRVETVCWLCIDVTRRPVTLSLKDDLTVESSVNSRLLRLSHCDYDQQVFFLSAAASWGEGTKLQFSHKGDYGC